MKLGSKRFNDTANFVPLWVLGHSFLQCNTFETPDDEVEYVSKCLQAIYFLFKANKIFNVHLFLTNFAFMLSVSML